MDTNSNGKDGEADGSVVEPPKKNTPPRGWRIVTGIVSVLLFMVAIGMTLAVHYGRSMETAAGEWQTLHTVDGSLIRIAPNTAIDFDYGDDRRVVILRRGEVYVEVEHDEKRPFIVRTGSIDARAVGTRYAVTAIKNSIEVTVREGRVAVTHRDIGPDSAVYVSEGEQLRVAEWPRRPVKVDVEQKLAWTDRKIVLPDGATVASMVAELNRRNVVQIVIEDPAIAGARLVGVFAADEPQKLVDVLVMNRKEKGLPVRVVKEGTNVVRVIGGERKRS